MDDEPDRGNLREPALVFGAFLLAAWLLPLAPQTVLLQSVVGVGAVLGLLWSIARRKESLVEIGVRLDTLLPAMGVYLLVTTVLVAPAIAWDGEIEIAAEDVLGYFFWALFQQFLVVAGFWRNFRRRALPAALVFSLAHAPNLPLMALVFVVETLWLLLFRRFRSLFALALAHACAALVAGQTLVPEWLTSFRVGLHYFE
jgi:hypothetical protein